MAIDNNNLVEGIIKGIQWLTHYFCVQFTDTILGIVVFCQNIFRLNFHLAFGVFEMKKIPVGL